MIYNFNTSYGGRVRGQVNFEVEADTLEEAKVKAANGDYVHSLDYMEVRNDTEIDWDYSEVKL